VPTFRRLPWESKGRREKVGTSSQKIHPANVLISRSELERVVTAKQPAQTAGERSLHLAAGGEFGHVV